MSNWEENLFNAKAAPAPAAPPAPTPAKTTAHDAHRRYAQRALVLEVERVDNATIPSGERSGNRNDSLNTAAYNMGQLVGAGVIDEAQVCNELAAAAARRQMDPREVAAILPRSVREGAQQPRTLPELATDTGDDLDWINNVNKSTGEIRDAATTMPSKAEQEAFWGARPALGTIRQAAQARMASPWAVLGCVLCRVITVTPPDVVLPPLVGGPGSLNLFIGLVENSGGGKGAAERAARDAIDLELDINKEHEVNVGSGEGIIHAFVKPEKGGGQSQHHIATLVSVAEIDTLAATSKRQGATIMPILRSGWSGERLGFQNADASRRLHVEAHQYRLTMVAGIQPGRAGTLLDDSDGGTPQRFIWLPAGDPDVPDEEPPMPPPVQWVSVGTRSADPFFGGKTIMDVDPAIQAHVRQERRDRLRGKTPDHLGGHDTFCRLKLAAAFTILDGRLHVSQDDWDLSGVMHRVSLATREATAAGLRSSKAKRNRSAGIADAERADAAAEAAEAKALKRVTTWVTKRLIDGPSTSGALRKAASSRNRPYVDLALSALVATGRVAVDNPADGGSQTYKLGD
jgi:hypothetical protein